MLKQSPSAMVLLTVWAREFFVGEGGADITYTEDYLVALLVLIQ